MFGLRDFNNQLRGLINTSFNTTVKQFLVDNIPQFAFFETTLNKFLARSQLKLLHDRRDSNTVDRNEISQVMKSLRKDVVGTWNPFGIAWAFMLSIFGTRRSQRISTNVNALKEYSQMNDAPRFVNETLKHLITLMHKRINQVESAFSKLGITTSKAVFEDKTVKELKEAFRSWVQVFSNIVHGGVAGMGISANDVRFLRDLESQLTYGSHNVYLRDLAPALSQVLKQGQSLIANQSASYANSEGLNRPVQEYHPGSRAQGQRLAQPALAA
jgi:hypothetical protein